MKTDSTANDLVPPLTHGEAALMRMVSGADAALLSYLRQPATQWALVRAEHLLDAASESRIVREILRVDECQAEEDAVALRGLIVEDS